MPADQALLDKLRTMITHDGTPANERRAALERLERLVRGHDGPTTIATRITRSVRIGHKRRMSAVDERARLGAYTQALTLGDCIGRIARACGQHGRLPQQIDFGCHDGDKPVIAVHFPAEEAPNALEFSSAIGGTMPETRVNLANRADPGERLFLLYPPGRVSDLMVGA